MHNDYTFKTVSSERGCHVEIQGLHSPQSAQRVIDLAVARFSKVEAACTGIPGSTRLVVSLEVDHKDADAVAPFCDEVEFSLSPMAAIQECWEGMLKELKPRPSEVWQEHYVKLLDTLEGMSSEAAKKAQALCQESLKNNTRLEGRAAVELFGLFLQAFQKELGSEQGQHFLAGQDLEQVKEWVESCYEKKFGRPDLKTPVINQLSVLQDQQKQGCDTHAHRLCQAIAREEQRAQRDFEKILSGELVHGLTSERSGVPTQVFEDNQRLTRAHVIYKDSKGKVILEKQKQDELLAEPEKLEALCHDPLNKVALLCCSQLITSRANLAAFELMKAFTEKQEFCRSHVDGDQTKIERISANEALVAIHRSTTHSRYSMDDSKTLLDTFCSDNTLQFKVTLQQGVPVVSDLRLQTQFSVPPKPECVLALAKTRTRFSKAVEKLVSGA